MSSPVILSEFNSTADVLGYVTVELNKQRLACKNLSTNQVISTLYFDSADLTHNSNDMLQVSVIKFFIYNGVEICVIGLSNGELWLYSFNSNEVLQKLNTSSNFQITDVEITNNGDQLYCNDLNNTLYQFDLTTFELVWKLKMDEYLENVVKFQLVPSSSGDNKNSQKILLCSHTICLLDLESKKVEMNFPGHVTQIKDIKIIPNTTYFITSAENDRFLNVYDFSDGSTKVVLNCVETISSFSVNNENLISCVTVEGELESFIKPFNNDVGSGSSSNNNNNKRKKRQQISKKSTIKLRFQQSSKHLKIINCQNNKNDNNSVLITWLENASIPFSKKIEINENIDYSSTNNTIVIPPNIVKSGSKHYQTSDISSNVSYKEGNALVTSGDNFTNIESEISNVLNSINEDELELTLQDQLQIHANKVDQGGAATSTNNKNITSNNGLHKKKKQSKKTVIGTLTVILQQALKSNDHTLLDQVLSGTLDEQVIKLTIYKLSPQLSVVLLERLAERIARNSKSFQSSNSVNSSSSSILEVWCKWCLIIHGAYLTSVPNLVNSLSTLHSTMRKRASLLKKLSIIEERLNSVIQRNDLFSKNGLSEGDEYLYDEEDDQEDDQEDGDAYEEDVEYVEELDDAGLLDDGEEDNSDSDEEDDDGDDDDENDNNNTIEERDHKQVREENGDFSIDKELVQEDAFSDEEM